MRKRASVFVIVSVCAVAAFGQQSSKEENDVANEEKIDPGKLSDDEIINRSETALAKCREVRRYVQHLLDQARRAKDIIKITCLNDKLTQINVNIRTYEDRMQTCKNAIKIGDRAARNHEFNVLTILEQKILTLRMEAEACIGEAEGYLGKTEVVVTRPKGIAELDPTATPLPGIDVIERPPPASAFQ